MVGFLHYDISHVHHFTSLICPYEKIIGAGVSVVDRMFLFVTFNVLVFTLYEVVWV